MKPVLERVLERVLETSLKISPCWVNLFLKDWFSFNQADRLKRWPHSTILCSRIEIPYKLFCVIGSMLGLWPCTKEFPPSLILIMSSSFMKIIYLFHTKSIKIIFWKIQNFWEARSSRGELIWIDCAAYLENPIAKWLTLNLT